MVVFNKTSKIIGVGGTPVLPLAFATVPDTFEENPILQRMADEGHIVINPSERTERTVIESQPADNPPIPEIPASAEALPAAEVPAPETRESAISEATDPKMEDVPSTESSAKKKAGKS